MRQTMFTLLFGMAAATAGATELSDDCAALGLDNDYLAQLFCSQLESLTDSTGTGTTRSITQDGNPDAESPVAEWENIGLIQDAYRADPRKTLELIERIKGVGGLANEITN